MADWITPVHDRTQADVDYAKSQLASKINNVEYKGCFNPSDINRIEGNTRYLADILNKLYYKNNITTKTNWDKNSTISLAHIDRIINNIDALWEKYQKPPEASDLPATMLRYTHINTIEKNLYLIKEMLDNMTSSFRECGTFTCGGE